MLICGVAGFLVAWSLIPILQRFSSRWESTRPERSFHHTHATPIPRFGGVAIAAGFIVVVLIAIALTMTQTPQRSIHWGIIAGALAVFAVGLRDDCKPLGAKFKLIAQILIASAVYLGGVQIDQVKNPVTGAVYELGAWGFLATVFWLVAMSPR